MIVREETQAVSITTEAHINLVLPDTPYALWARGELDDHLGIPHEFTRVEIIGGEIVVSPAPFLEHGGIIQDLVKLLVKAELTNPEFPWECIQGTGLDLVGLQDGYIPDLVVLDAEVLPAARQAKVRYLVPDQVEMVVEVTSLSNAANDRRPQRKGAKFNKWAGYARTEIPYYLLIDRDPKNSQVILYSIPDQGTGAYLHEESWQFGETIHLPEPFGLEIPTEQWLPWEN
jgi:Putative restriction endonuclease